MKVADYYNNPSKIPQVGPGEGNVYTDLAPTCEAREVVSDRPLAQEKHSHIIVEKRYSSGEA